MIRLRTLVLLSIGLVLSGFRVSARVPVGGVLVSARRDDTPCEPGTVLRRTVLVSNRLEDSVDLLEEVGVPSGWRVLPLDEPRFPLASGKDQVRILAVVVPKDAAGTFFLTYRLRTAVDGVDVLKEVAIPVTVRGIAQLRMELQDAPEYLMASIWSTGRVHVVNSGGVPLNVRLEVQAAPVADLRLDTNSFRLAAGESRLLELGIAPKVSALSRFNQAIRVTARVTDDSGSPVSVPILGAGMDVIGGGSTAVDPWISIPSRLQFGSVVGLDGRSAQFVQVSGIGLIDATDDRIVSYRLRPRIPGDSPFLMNQEGYTISCLSTSLDLTIGDGNYSVSPLVQSTGLDRGFRCDSHAGPTRAGALWATSTAPGLDETRSGGYLEHDLSPWWTVRGGLLHQETGVGPTNRPLGDIASIMGRFWRTNRFRVELEAARSDTDARAPGPPGAYRVDLSARLPRKATLSAQARHIETGFLSPSRDNDSLSSSLQIPVDRRSRVEVAANQVVVGLHGNTAERLGEERTGEFRSEAASVQVHRNVDNRTRVSAGVQQRNRGIQNRAGSREVEEQTANASVSRQFGRMTPSLNVESGAGLDSRSATRSLVSRVGARMDYRRTRQQNYGLFAQYGDPILAVDLSPSVSVGASAEWELGPRTRIDLLGAHEYVPDSGERRESISASARRVLGNGHEVGVRTQLIESGSGSAEAGLFVSYSIPFGLPVGKKRGLASIQGRIYDQDDRLGFGVSKAVVSLNREFKTVTAADGSFSFSGLRSGSYLVEVEPRSIGFGRIVAATSPVVVVAKPDTSTRLEVGVTAGATIEAVITIFEDSIPIAGSSKVPESERYRPKGPAVGEVVEIQSEKVVRRLMTDTQGVVRFSGLQPGLWTVRAGLGALPPNHYLETPLLTRELRPGAAERVEFRVLPRKRVLRFIDDG